MPVLTVIAGPNGSGKSTLTRRLMAANVDFGVYISPHEISRTMSGSPAEQAQKAQAEAHRIRESCIAAGADFSFETVMSHPSEIDVIQRAKNLGFAIVLYFVGLADARQNVVRVRQRVAKGGYSVPEDQILARYERTMRLLPAAFLLADDAVIFDNTVLNGDDFGGLRMIVTKSFTAEIVSVSPPTPSWVSENLLQHLLSSRIRIVKFDNGSSDQPEAGMKLLESSVLPKSAGIFGYETGANLRLTRNVQINRSRDDLLTDFGRRTLEHRYLLPGESYQDMFARVATAFADDADHAQRVYDYISRLWFMPSAPILWNGGASRGLPISCCLNAVLDSLESIVGTWNQNAWLAANSSSIGTYWGGVRSIGEKGKGSGQTRGVIPFIRVMESIVLATSQDPLRHSSATVTIDIHHPEIEEFLEIRQPSGDLNAKSLNLHHGISINDEFMHAVRDGAPFALRSPKTSEVLRTVDARNLWQRILELRLQTGEPYLIFLDAVNRAVPMHQKELGLRIRQSSQCSEIMLHTGVDHLGVERIAVCCLSSVNAEMFLEWREHPTFMEDIMRFLDNVLQKFIDSAPAELDPAAYAAMRERSVGLGLMGFHSFLQGQNVPFESAMAKSWNMRLFNHLRRGCDAASLVLAEERGPCPDAGERGVMERFSHKLAIAPTASISIICGGTSAGIEPIPANIYTHETLGGSFVVRNPYLERLLEETGCNTPAIWDSILEQGGSVAHLDILTDDEKSVFKTAFEIDQRVIIDLAADRTPKVCQSQSVSVFLPGDVDRWDLHMLHWDAWERGMKSLYKIWTRTGQGGPEKSLRRTDYDRSRFD